ncbi:uncharacterized protein LOC110733827 [Chenopodium quinoa]|uniref:uncharacterized protein LOC110733827 n=1 Tax=Chenopodium quinoa TaxID=63459 RepID=UPI000B76F930|nr:uncharacterized protein LOC110733827 [Chenopodium quinoa]XP_021769600.1 uncharacterized protein LOC110733827 [Chenopodium quinoa]XP_021769606.1 uncharacterized protein LOC110733827 [Chenopodium quinoa]XP_021769614.1 uncharacterized protein LOC110733827 [Chenopodium quinoa]
MDNTGSVDVILEFLQKNGFSRAEAALLNELGNRPDNNGFQKLTLEEERGKKAVEENVESIPVQNHESGSWNSCDVSKELIVKEIECGSTSHGKKSKWNSNTSIVEHRTSGEADRVSEKNFSFSKESDDTVLDLCTWRNSQNNGTGDPCKSSSSIVNSGVLELQSSESSNAGKVDLRPDNDSAFPEKRLTWVSSSGKASVDTNYKTNQPSELKDVDKRKRNDIMQSKSNFGDELDSRNEEASNSSSGQWNVCAVKTVLSFSNINVPTTSDSVADSGTKEGFQKPDMVDIRAAIKEQVDEVGRSLYLAKLHGTCDKKDHDYSGFSLVSESQKEDYPRLPPVRLKSEDKPVSANWEERFDNDGPSLKLGSVDTTYLLGSYLDVPVGQEISSSGAKRMTGGNWLSVSRGITEDASDMVSGFATIGDGLSESIDYPNDYWDSDEYDDDDDVGYMRQPIEDEAWFLAHEIDYPSDNEKGTGHGSIPDNQERAITKVEEDDQSFAEEDSYFSGEQYIHSKNLEPISASDDPIGLSVTEVYEKADGNDIIAHYDGQLMDEEELNLMRSEPVWQGFVTQSDDLIMLGDGKVMNEFGRSVLDDGCIDDDQHGSVRSIGVGINSDVADFGSEVRDSLIGGSSEGDFEYFHDHEIGLGAPKHPQIRTIKDRKKASRHDSDKYLLEADKDTCLQLRSHSDVGFSFAPPARGEPAGSSKPMWSSNNNSVGDEHNDCIRNDGMLASWKHKSSGSSPARSPEDETNAPVVRSAESTPSTLSDYAYVEKERVKRADDKKTASMREDDVGACLEDEEAAAVQEQVRQIKAQEEEFETFNLKIVHRKNRTGFEEDKNFHVVLNSVIAGRYHVTEYLGSAAFSKAIQAHDLHTGMDVCVKIIKNNKDFFDQSLDEIKLLKYVNKHDPADKYHLLRLYDYFYYREHLLIVCELLKANLYEFHKFNRESGGEVYFTMPRLQSITIQVLEALQFLHGLGLIHCDLKPENILVKSYSRCEVKVIDLGSSCFETDHLCSYVQSRSYRAPEVILGLPYDKKIDVWSLGCILAELCTGNVLFQNDSPATLLARVIGIIGPIDQDMLAKGRDTYKYFTKNHMLYERNQETSRLEYLIPKKTSLRHRLPMGDQGFIDFVAHLLEINPRKRPSAFDALKHPWLSYPYEPISS